MSHSRYEQLREWFASLELRDRLRIMSAACCSNPNPVMGEDACTGAPVSACANCGART